jgi:hypothetical protein
VGKKEGQGSALDPLGPGAPDPLFSKKSTLKDGATGDCPPFRVPLLQPNDP